MPGSSPSLGSLSSPSPTPPPREEHQSNHGDPTGLDSGSELSELTEEEQDNDTRPKEDDTTRSVARKKKQRGDLSPQDMWGWVKKPAGKEKGWRSTFEEEEEEEQAGPATAMEEEEEDDQDKGMDSDREVSLDKDGALSDNEVVDDDEEEAPEGDVESGDEALPRETRNSLPGDVSGDDNDDPDYVDPDEADIQQSPKPVASPDLTDDEHDNAGEDEIYEDDVQDVEPTTKEGSEVDEEEEVGVDDVELPDADELPTTEAATPANGIEEGVDVDPDATMDVDAVPNVLLSPVAVAASSITAGGARPPSPSFSQPSTPSGSRASSRFPSAEPGQEQEVPSEPEAEPEPERKAPTSRGSRARKAKGRTRAARRSRAAAVAEAPEGDADNDHAQFAEGEGLDADDDVATPDLDLDSDLQPAHRAEALDELARIELKFSLLRERLYVEKMDSLAWEEGLIADGSHPELLHLHAELSQRRDKRLELAARRRDFEVENVRKRRRLDESGAWSTWKNERDELQKAMIAETNGKKRRLERERKMIERPPPVRVFPMPMHDVPPAPSLRDIVKSSPFGLPEITGSNTKRSRKKEQAPQHPLAYPTLAPLSRGEIYNDLELFHAHRHVAAGYDPHRHMPGLMNAVLGGGIPPGIDPYVLGMQVVDGAGRFVPPPQQHGMIQGFAPQPRHPHHQPAPLGMMQHPPHAQMPMDPEIQAAMRQPGHPLHPSQFGPGPGAGPLMRRSISPVPLGGGGQNSVPTTLGGGPVPPGFAGAKPNGWSGPSSSKDSRRMNGETDRERMTEVLAQKERADRERLQRELDREREREAERSYQMPHAQPRHHTHAHVHNNPQAQSAHSHPHTHPHHHHHVHHHHHGPGTHPPPMAGLPSNAGPAHQTLSPHSSRGEFEQRRPRSGAPTEVIELSVSQSKPSMPSPSMSAFWQGNDDSVDHRERERGRATGPLGPPPLGPNERMMTPFTMGPSQALQRSLPGSPRNMLGGTGPSNPPPMTSSRRGSWSAAAEDMGHGRPSSSASGAGFPPGPSGSGSQRGSVARLPPPPSVTGFHESYGSSPRSNGRTLPPSSPSSTPYNGSLRSPVRSTQQGRVPIGGPLSPPPSLPLSPRPMGGPPPRVPRGSSPPLTKAPLPKLGGFPIPESGNIAQIPMGTGGSIPPSSAMLPPLSSALPPSRMANGSLAEKVAPQLPPAKAVSVPGDGS